MEQWRLLAIMGMRRGSLFIIALSICLIFACVSNEKVDAGQIQKLYNSMAYEEIVRKYENINWKSVNDSSLVVYYCNALIETNRDLPSTLRHPNVPISMEQFAKGYLLLRTGKLQESLLIFIELSNSVEGKFWGTIGLIEYEFFAENITSLEESLPRLAQLNETIVLPSAKRALSEYSAWLAYLKGDYSRARDAIQKSENMTSSSLFELNINILLRENKLAEALRAVEDKIKELPDYQEAYALKAQVYLRTKSLDDSLLYLAEVTKKHPRMWKLQMLYAESLINAGRTTQGLTLLQRIVEERPFDVFPSIALAELDLLHGSGKIAPKVIDTYKLSLVGLPAYDVMLSRGYWYAAKKEKAHELLDLALSMNPFLADALWLQYEMQVSQKNFKDARKSLETMRKMDPFDVAILVELANLSCIDGTPRDFDNYRAQLLQSGRFISDKVKKELTCK